ncbi:hypothetical protein BDK92_3347 [Micromonospora pisi]|uniref:Uncharacterized protein n=1 Tax=Micromonospora pisi TaxID=589240 RepID=A0A495JJA2_9ACTN|nr:hypothetical protein [Micromonospora pisi]RKR89013.1 hypothetical protein BDK92_3347 [Micromonospora pisi]
MMSFGSVAPCWRPRSGEGRARFTPTVGGFVVLLWVSWAMLAWWSAPRPVDADQARRDIAAGAVTSVETGWGMRSGDFWGAPPAMQGDRGGSMVAWTTKSGRVRYTDAGPQDPVDQSGNRSVDNPRPQRRLIADLTSAVGRGGSGISLHWIGFAAQSTAVVAMVVFLFALVPGPAPVHGTRWFWFWISLVPYGLGVLAWVGRERWRPDPRAALAPRLPGVEAPGWKRARGYDGFLIGIGLGIALTMLTYVLRWILGPGVVPG